MMLLKGTKLFVEMDYSIGEGKARDVSDTNNANKKRTEENRGSNKVTFLVPNKNSPKNQKWITFHVPENYSVKKDGLTFSLTKDKSLASSPNTDESQKSQSAVLRYSPPYTSFHITKKHQTKPLDAIEAIKGEFTYNFI